ncbi:MAG: bifunctional riboflavin kinase/FAD synthetase [Bacteroidia bacterium]|nr:bifunctional riboflavin kinase/FAD synthetase [Bacteroidia bacterium]
MKIYHGIEAFKSVENAVITIGTFDGVHKGHQKIIKRLTQIAAANNGEVVLLTFFPHPRMVLHPDDHGISLLNTLDEKVDLLKKYGIQHLIVHQFTKEFSRLTSTEFVRDILVNKLKAKHLVIGYDHHFGRNREGTIENLEEMAPIHHFELEQISKQDIDHIAVSSTKIRNALQIGDVALANKYLGHNYSLRGEVVKGNSDGKKLGFPTANIRMKETFKLIPANGVYVGFVNVNGENLKCMINIGNRPTFENADWAIEAHLLDFDGDLYGKNLVVEFITRLRAEQKFESLEGLKTQLKEDKIQALKLLS